MFIGYVLVLGAVQTSQKSSTAVAILVPIVAPILSPFTAKTVCGTIHGCLGSFQASANRASGTLEFCSTSERDAWTIDGVKQVIDCSCVRTFWGQSETGSCTSKGIKTARRVACQLLESRVLRVRAALRHRVFQASLLALWNLHEQYCRKLRALRGNCDTILAYCVSDGGS
jgi:hypothetical protein